MDRPPVHGSPEPIALPFALPSGYEPLALLSHNENRWVLDCVSTRDSSRSVLKCLVPPFEQAHHEALCREYLLLESLSHPMWVRPIRFGRLPQGGHFLELERAAGVPLRQAGRQAFGQPFLHLCRGVLSALQVLHRLSHAQLDLHPDQILFERGETENDPPRVALLDLGLAQELGRANRAAGTAGYTAPEVLRAEGVVSIRSDLYSFGAILYELLAGLPAFPGRTVGERVRAQLEGVVSDEPLLDVDAPSAIVRLIHELLALDPARRPESVEEVWFRLRGFQIELDPLAPLPRLIGSSRPPFVGREAERAQFVEWLEQMDHAPSIVGIDAANASPVAQCEIHARKGLGGRRLLRHLVALAETRGFEADARRESVVDEEGSWRGAKDLGDAHVPIELSIRVVREAPTHAPSPVGTLHLALQPFSLPEMEQMAAGLGIESPALRAQLSALVPGRPELLQALIDILPPRLDFTFHHTTRPVLDLWLERTDPPERWVAFAGEELKQQPPAARRSVVRCALFPNSEADAVSASSSPFANVLWRRATVRAAPDFCDRLLAEAFERESEAPLPNWTPLLRAALEAGHATWVERLLEPALLTAPTVDDPQEIMRLYGLALTVIQGKLQESDRLCARLVRAGIETPHIDGLQLLPWWTEEHRCCSHPDAGVALKAWGLAAARRTAEFESLLPPLDQSLPPASDAAFLIEMLRCRHLLLSAPQEVLEVCARIRREWAPLGDYYALALLEPEFKARFEIEPLDEVSRDLHALSPEFERRFPVRGLTVHWQEGRTLYGVGRGDDAERVMRECVHRVEVLGRPDPMFRTGLASLLIMSGRFEESCAWHAELAAEASVTPDGDAFLDTALRNGALSHSECGRGRIAVRLAREACAHAHPSEGRLRHAVRALGWILGTHGQAETLLDLTARFQVLAAGNPSFARFLDLARAMALASLGEIRESREHWQAATGISTGLTSNAPVVDYLTEWMLWETALNQDPPVDTIFATWQRVSDSLPPAGEVRKHLAFVEARLLGWIPIAGDEEGNLRRFLVSFEAQSRAPYLWRAHWRLASLLASNGDKRSADRHRDLAREILVTVLEAEGGPVEQEAYCRLPHVRTFLAEAPAK